MTSGETYRARNTPAIVGPITPPIVLKVEFIAVAIPVSNGDNDCMTMLIIDTIMSPILTDSLLRLASMMTFCISYLQSSQQISHLQISHFQIGNCYI